MVLGFFFLQQQERENIKTWELNFYSKLYNQLKPSRGLL